MAAKCTVAVCSLARSDDEYKHFISVLKEKCGVCVKYVHITSRILESGHDFSQYDGVILIHSVYRGRMSLTDVRDARYQTLLLHWKGLLGRDRVAVIVTGVMEGTENLEERFKEKQPTVSKCSAYVLFCGAGDPMNDDHVANAMKSFVRLLPDRPKVRKVQAKPSKVTTKLSEDNSDKETMTLTAKKVKCAGIDVKNSKGKIHVELIICAEGSTRQTLLKTLSEDDLKDEADFIIFQQKVDDWEILETRSITSFDPSSKLMHCAVFIFSNGVPQHFTEGEFKVFEEIINGRTNHTDIEVSGKADKSCLQQLLNVLLECPYNDHIVTVSPGGVQTANSLSRNQTQREREHQYEATLKKEARGRIQILNQTISTLRQELRCKENELTTCEDNISEKRCEQNNIQSEVDDKKKKLQLLTEHITKAQQKLEESSKEFHTKEKELRKVKDELHKIENNREQMSTELQVAEKEVTQSEKKIKEVIQELEAYTHALSIARKELNPTKNKIEEILAELQNCTIVAMEAKTEISQAKTNKEEELTEFEARAIVPMEVDQIENKEDELVNELEALKNTIMKKEEGLHLVLTKAAKVVTEGQAIANAPMGGEMEVSQKNKKIEELMTELQAFNNDLRKKESELNQTKAKTEEELTEFEAPAIVPMEEEIEVNQTKKKIEELLKELQAFKNALKKTERELNQTKIKTEEMLTEFQAFAKTLKNVKKEHQTKRGCQIS